MSSPKATLSPITHPEFLTLPQEPEFLTLPQKPTAPISYTFHPSLSLSPSTKTPETLLIFLNGLGLPASSWTPTITILHSQPSYPSILTYDRFSQGLTTSRDPVDGTPGKEHGHDFLDVAEDLHALILVIAALKLNLSSEDVLREGRLEVLLVGASIGVNIARVYVERFGNEGTGCVKGLICLDSNIANKNYSEILPSVSSPSFDKQILGDECNVEEYEEAREKLISMFDFEVRNKEGLNRLNSRELLPADDGPKLRGRDGEAVQVRVVGHDPEAFVRVGWQMMRTPRCLSEIINRYWAKYNEGLTRLTGPEKSGPVVIAKGCGHFIQKDDPAFVAEMIVDIW